MRTYHHRRVAAIIMSAATLAIFAYNGKALADHFNPILKGPAQVCQGGPKDRIFPVDIAEDEWNLGKNAAGKDVIVDAWMFNGTIPGEVFEACEGDTITYRVTNRGSMPHGFDPHSLNIGAEAFKPMEADESRDITGIADVPGIFMHHCAAEEMTDAHIVMGMGSATVVYPRKPMTKARDIVVVIGATPDGKYFFNGDIAHKPIMIKKGEPVRLWIQSVAHGHNTIHVIGANNTTFYSGWDAKRREFVSSGTSQGYTLTNGNGVIIEFTPKTPGKRILVDHDKLDQLGNGFAMPFMAQ